MQQGILVGPYTAGLAAWRRAVTQLQTLAPQPRDLGGGFMVRRLLPSADRRAVGPFVFFDHFGPIDVAPGANHDVRPHPHIGLATLTYLFEGAIMHRDSTGVVQRIEPGAVNWMSAGRGIVHSERTPKDLLDERAPQPWPAALARPAGGARGRRRRRSSTSPPSGIPTVRIDGATVHVVAGTRVRRDLAGRDRVADAGAGVRSRRRQRHARWPCPAPMRASARSTPSTIRSRSTA